MRLPFRTGIGYDVHQLVEGRALIIGGVRIPYSKGLLGHSDADVLVHAIEDALLGALALGDIGKLFPDTDPQYKDADSVKMLQYVVSLLQREGYAVGNVDSVVMAEAPKLAPYIPAMRAVLAEALHVSIDAVSIKATTTEHLGFVGRKEGVAATATVLLYRNTEGSLTQEPSEEK